MKQNGIKIDTKRITGYLNQGMSLYTKMPEGWSFLKGTRTQPRGCEWISNNKKFGEGRCTALLLTNKESI